MRALFAVPLLAAAFCAPAQADWLFTKWGMTTDEVLAAGRGQVVPADTEATEPQRYKDQIPLLQMPYSVGEFTFKVLFRFTPHKNRLASVVLILEKKGDPVRLLAYLQDKYGASFRQQQNEVGLIKSWADGADAVTYTCLLNRAAVAYEPNPNFGH